MAANAYLSKLRNQLLELEDKWERSARRHTAGPSKENWRFEKKLKIASHNKSAEKTLEKAIAAQAGDAWVNQVPTASGLFDSTHDRHRNIDLVRRISPEEYEFIELKVHSNDPLYALDELTTYGVYYVFARLHYPMSYIGEKELLRAKHVHLVVLAPYAYYLGYDLSPVASAANKVWRLFMERHSYLDLEIDCAFEAFPKDFIWPNPNGDFLEALSGKISMCEHE